MSEDSGFGSRAWVTCMIPFQVIRPDSLPQYSVSLEQINTNQYDHGVLSQVVASLPEPRLEQLPLLVSFDGGLALPVIAPYDCVENAISRFNRVLCALLLGGIEVEAIDSRHVVLGALYENTHVWPVNDGLSLDAHLHAMLRTRVASSFDTIVLNKPKNVLVSEFRMAYERGNAVLENIPNLTPTFLLKGHTELKYRNWNDALASLWIVVEQLTDYLWQHKLLEDPKKQIDSLPNRKKSLREDSRTWTLAVRQEILWQVGILSGQTYELLFPSRQARNNLVHEGKTPDREVISGLYEAVIQLMENAGMVEPLGIRAIPMGKYDGSLPNVTNQSLEDWKYLGKSVRDLKE